MKISFFGAAQTVTGSRYLVETANSRILVDCGMFQGLKKLRERNWSALPFDPASLDAVVLTHAHIDHSGYLPKLCKMGFRGPVYVTAGTRDLLGILLPDAGFLQEEEARHANRWGYSKHSPAEPLFTRADAEHCLAQLQPFAFHANFAPMEGIRCSFTRAGHIIGSGCLALEAEGVRVAFSGDVGRPVDPIMKPPEVLPETDVLVVESTYGDRRHPEEHVADTVARYVNETAKRGGVLLVPAFAVGRAQHLLHIVGQLRAVGRIPELPVFLDSPMAIDATKIFCDHRVDHRLSDAESQSMARVAKYTRTTEESKDIDRRLDPMIVIAASGMATGGRVLHHLRRFLPDERNTVLFVGYQASGTRGRSLVDGTDEIKLYGQYVRVRAHVVQVEGLSAHADYAEMLDWLRASNISPQKVFVTHGEPGAADAFRRRLMDCFGWKAIVPGDGSTFTLP
jgi:metallo-beta-lactamase family protein